MSTASDLLDSQWFKPRLDCNYKVHKLKDFYYRHINAKQYQKRYMDMVVENLELWVDLQNTKVERDQLAARLAESFK